MTKAEQWIQSLTAARQELLTFLQSLTQAQWQQPVFSEGTPWTVTTVVSHLIDAERGMSIQVHRARNGEPTVPEGFDINRWNAGVQERIGALSPEELLSRLETTRAKTLEVLNSLGEQEWSMTGRHPSRGVITIEQYYETIAAHDRVHLEDIKKGLAT
ncbi:MAG: DinB family protein [Caldilineaceae bacterium]